MAIKQDWDSSFSLPLILSREYWWPHEDLTWHTLAGLFEIDNDDPDGGSLVYLGKVGALSNQKEAAGITERLNKASLLRHYWEVSGRGNEKQKPAFFIEWAIERKQPPEWLDWAIKNNYYTSEQATDDQVNSQSAKPESSRKIDNLLRALTTIAIDAYGYDSKLKKSPIPTEIVNAMAKHGFEISDKTVRDWLKKGDELLEPSCKKM